MALSISNLAGDTHATALTGDRALQHSEEDVLGFRELAANIATAVSGSVSDDGSVIGIEGAWGSGKSSLLFLIEEELSRLPTDSLPTVIKFEPWLIGNRDALLVMLFESLGKELNRISFEQGDANGIVEAKAKKAVTALRKFTKTLTLAGTFIETVGDATGLIPVVWAGKGMQGLKSMVEGEPADPDLENLKGSLTAALRDLGHKFIITIDDVDRLEAMEALEVLRLVRSVADFPHVTYLLCYDGEVLAQSIMKGAQIDDGHAYLEKIIQLTVMVPEPESFRLRNWFGEELQKIGSIERDDGLVRLRAVIDHDGGRYLTSPRSVTRTLDLVRFNWSVVREHGIDFADLVWLQLMKCGNPKLYKWVERYCAKSAMLALGVAQISDTTRACDLEQLLGVVTPTYFDDLVYRHHFADQLLGVSAIFSEVKGVFRLYDDTNIAELDDLIAEGRLASPDHYRFYFALSTPSHALTKLDLDELRLALNQKPRNVEELILQWYEKPILGNLSKADMLFDRLRGSSLNLSPGQAESLLLALAGSMDDAYRIRSFDRWWPSSTWDRADQLIPILLTQINTGSQNDVLERMFTAGKALSWLVRLYRRAILAYGKKNTSNTFWGVIDVQWNIDFDRAMKAMLSRFKKMSNDDIGSVIDLSNLLFAWHQSGDLDGPRKFAQSELSTDEGMIQLLEGLTSYVNSSDRGQFQVLRRETISLFMDYDEVKGRVMSIPRDTIFAGRLVKLIAAFHDGVEY